MKTPTLIAIAAALGGFAVGWLAKPSGPSAEEIAAATDSGGQNGKSPRNSGGMDGKSREREEAPLVLKARGAEHPVEDPKASAAEREFQRAFSSAGERTRTSRLNRMVEAMGLSAEQRKAVETLLAGRREGFKDLQGRGKTPSEVVAEAANAERIFENEVKKVLDAEQVQAYDNFKAREKENDIEARALRDLRDLIGHVDLNETQREQALEALRKGSADALERLPEGWGLINESMDVMGSTYLDAFDEMTGFLDDPEAMKNPQEIQRRMVEAKRIQAEDRASRLNGILTPAQLSQYRATQDARTSFLEATNPPPAPSVNNR